MLEICLLLKSFNLGGRIYNTLLFEVTVEGLIIWTPCIHFLFADLRTLFLIECLDDLKKKLMQRGLNLLIQHGKPEEVIPVLVKAYGAHTVKEL